MASAQELLQQGVRLKMLGMGYPKSGKTPSLIPLLLAGYKVRMLDFDDGTASLLRFIPPERLGDIDLDVQVLTDEVGFEKNDQAYAGPVGTPRAYKRAWELMKRWEYTAADGSKVDLGSSKDWGPDTVVVLDTLTGHGNAAMRRVRKMNSNVQDLRRLSFPAQQEQEAFLDLLTHQGARYHVIIFSHLKVIGPKEPELAAVRGSLEEQRQIEAMNAAKIEASQRAMDLIPTRIYPTCVGAALPPHISKRLNTVVHYKKTVSAGGKVKRVISWEPTEEMDLAVAGRVLGPDGKTVYEVDQETGLLRIMEAVAGKLVKPTAAAAPAAVPDQPAVAR